MVPRKSVAFRPVAAGGKAFLFGRKQYEGTIGKSETRRSKFARLLAYVRNDYQAYAVQLGTNYIGINESIKQDIPENIVYDIDVDDQVDSSDKIMEENVNYETNDESNSSTANTSTSLEDELLDMVRKAGL